MFTVHAWTLVRTRAFTFVAVLALAFVSQTCGEKAKKKSSGGGTGTSKVEQQFNLAANANKLPVRMIIAAAILESNISPEFSRVPYLESGETAVQKKLGTRLTETAFGITRKDLGLEGNEKADQLEEQIQAYAKYVRAKADEDADHPFLANPTTLEDKFYWIWKLATIHRHGEELRRNVRVIWAKELMALLNTGALWQDPATGELLELKPETPKFKEEELPADAQKLFRLEYEPGEINYAQMFELTSENLNTLLNSPQRIEVVHCPLSLSACLELQDSTIENEVKLGAHFVIPRDNSVLQYPVQIMRHDRRIDLTGKDGKAGEVSNAIVIMLVGQSGRFVEGIRKNANPAWYTPWQLSRLGRVISGSCKFLQQRYPENNYQNCAAVGKADGVNFHTQDSRERYRWGDIPDYDESLFGAYLRYGDAATSGETVMEFPKGNKTFEAGKNIELIVRFQQGVKTIKLERAIRCKDQTIVWDTMVNTQFARGRTSYAFKDLLIYDGGPNGSGRQFLRVLIYGENNELMAWVLDDLYVTKFDKNLFPPSEKCKADNNR